MGLHCHTKSTPKGCDLIPDYVKCQPCQNGIQGYNIGECVKICRLNNQGQKVGDIYRSLINDNTHHPADGLTKSPPTWEVFSLCSVLTELTGLAHPEPVVQGPDVTVTIGANGENVYTINPDTNTTNVSAVVNGSDLTITDSDGNTVVADVSSLISPPDIDFASTNTTVNGTNVTTQYLDSDGRVITTDTFDLPQVVDNNNGTFTYNGVTWVSDTDISNNTLVVDGLNIVSTVTEDGADIQAALPIADIIDAICSSETLRQTLRECLPLKSDLAVGIEVNNPTPTIGTDVILTITAENLGPEIEDQGVVTIPLPDCLTYSSHLAPAGTTFDPVTSVWTIGNMPLGSSPTLVITTVIG